MQLEAGDLLKGHVRLQHRPYSRQNSIKSLLVFLFPALVLMNYLHSTAFMHHGYGSLIDKLEFDFQRIGKRNLGRDDRVTSHWRKEVRYFLS